MEKYEIKIGDDVLIFQAEDKDLLFESANLLDEKIKVHKERYGFNSDPKKIIILASLNIINDLEREKLEIEQKLKDLTEKVNALNENMKIANE